MNELAKIFIFAGLFLLVVGIIIAVFGSFLPFGRLPGDIRFSRDGFSIYIPIVSCIVISVVLTVIINIILRILGR